MVKKRIARKPESSQPEDWINQGGVDPEIAPPPSPPKNQKPYPHRVSFDMAADQYKRLKTAAFKENKAMNELLREAIEQWLSSRNY